MENRTKIYVFGLLALIFLGMVSEVVGYFFFGMSEEVMVGIAVFTITSWFALLVFIPDYIKSDTIEMPEYPITCCGCHGDPECNSCRE